MGKSRNRDFWNFVIFHGFPYWKKCENLGFLKNSGIFRKNRKIKGGAFEIVNFRIFSNKEIHEKSRNFRNHDFATFPLSHFPTFREFFPPAPQPRIWAAAAWFREFVEKSKGGRQERLYYGKWSTVMKSLCSRRLLFSREKVRHNSRRRKWSFVQ